MPCTLFGQALLDQLELNDINLFIQDWGGLIGLRLLTANPDNFASVVAGNTMLPLVRPLLPTFLDWQNFAATSPKFDIATVLQRATTTDLSAEAWRPQCAFPHGRIQSRGMKFPA